MKPIDKKRMNIILGYDYIRFLNYVQTEDEKALIRYNFKINFPSEDDDLDDSLIYYGFLVMNNKVELSEADGLYDKLCCLEKVREHQEGILLMKKILNKIIKIKPVPTEMGLFFNREPKDGEFSFVPSYNNYYYPCGIYFFDGSGNLSYGEENKNGYRTNNLGVSYNKEGKNLSLIEILEDINKKGEIIETKLESLKFLDKNEYEVVYELIDKYLRSRSLFIKDYLYHGMKYELCRVELKFSEEVQIVDSKIISEIEDFLDSRTFFEDYYYNPLESILNFEYIIECKRKTNEEYFNIKDILSYSYYYYFRWIFLDRIKKMWKEIEKGEFKVPLEIQKLAEEIVGYRPPGTREDGDAKVSAMANINEKEALKYLKKMNNCIIKAKYLEFYLAIGVRQVNAKRSRLKSSNTISQN